MDSLTQVALGSCVASACVPPMQRRKAAVVGALLGTLPDLDVFLDYGDPVADFTMHRGFSHSLPVLAVVGFFLWWTLRTWWAPVRERPRRWLAAVLLALLTHPLLDAHTAYGTQLFWPAGSAPVSWATLFIIDPIYTIPLLAGMISVMVRPASRITGRVLVAGLVCSTIYLGWSWGAKLMVCGHAKESLEARGIRDARLFVTPTPFNTLLWRIVARTDGGHFEGLDSLVADDGSIRWEFHPSDDGALAGAGGVPAVARLQWFANEFVRASVEEGRLVVDDLRMGQHPDYVFRHVVAERGNPSWRAIEPDRLAARMSMERIKSLWQRLRSDEVGNETPESAN